MSSSVNEMFVFCQSLIAAGKGDYSLTCNNEYGIIIGDSEVLDNRLVVDLVGSSIDLPQGTLEEIY